MNINDIIRLKDLLDRVGDLSGAEFQELDQLRLQADAIGITYGDAPVRGHDNPNPTETELSSVLSEAGWTPEQLDQFLGYYYFHINRDGTTNITREQWERLADTF